MNAFLKKLRKWKKKLIKKKRKFVKRMNEFVQQKRELAEQRKIDRQKKKRSSEFEKAKKRAFVRIRGFLRKYGIFRDVNARKLAAYKNCHAGKRCFLIGNGPSLTVEDLDKIAGEISVGCNMVYKVFEQTKWRPKYHCITETAYAKRYAPEFSDNIHTPFFTTKSCKMVMPVCPADTVYVENLYTKKDYYVRGNLLDYYVTPYASVMVFMLELAIYMGFKEIYLLGVDNTNSLQSGGHFTEGYENKKIIRANVKRVKKQLNAEKLTPEQAGDYQVQRARCAYQRIAEHARVRGIQIFNATRGGALEVFPRVVLEDVLLDT